MPPLLDRIINHHRVDSRILIAFLALALGSFAFLELASEVGEGDTIAVDRWILQGLRSAADPSIPVGPAWLRGAMIDVTALGGVSVLTIVTAIAAGYLIAARKWSTAALLTAAIAGGALLSVLLKDVFERARPDLVVHLVEVSSTSFPSGHAMNAAVTYLTLGTLLARAEQGRRVRAYLILVAIGLTLLIGGSRVYLGVHWPSDVLAGWCVGATWAALCSLVARALQRRHAIEAPGEVDEPLS
ncbi:phosphatase PAP2 family protein [Sphingomonas japonica]|uniref:Undecaprenyl-diphosphatase n=1 Tax=Sphingomonas japonica TaxID=511662 RepID=A0ABX0TXZ7_9SPHN|nr:phosphatase PAP2 family protein [Sphingomonas japonica]NIJ23183.1 undecaprenyl-diphosphatase [Sphingomonas japonica]